MHNIKRNTIRKVINLLIILLLINSYVYGQNVQGVSIGKNGSPPDVSAILDIVSKEKGVLFPRLNKNDILNPVAGLFVYDSIDNGYYFHNDTGWVEISSAYMEKAFIDSLISDLVTTQILTVKDTLNLGDKRVIGISTDDNLGGAGASDDSLSTQLSIKSYVDNVMDANNEEDSSKITTDTIVSKIVTTDTLNLGDKRVIGISTDDNLGGAGASDDSLSTQLSIKTYVDNVIDANNEEDSSKITTDTIVSKIVTTDTLNLGDKRVIGISTDDNLGGAGASDDSLSTQLSIKSYVDNVIDGIQNNAPSLTTDTIVSKIVTTDTLNLGDKRVIGISTDDNLGGAGASDDSLSTQLSIKSYVDNVMDANNEEDSSKITTDTIVSKIVTTDTLNLGDKRVIGISTDDNLGGAGASDDSLSTQLSIKTYVDNVIDGIQNNAPSLTTDTIVSKIVTTDTLNLGDKRVIGISTDDNLGGAGASDDSLSTQLSIKSYVDNVMDANNEEDSSKITTDTIVSKIVTTDTLNLGDKRVIGISTDDNLGGAGASDDSLSTQLSIKSYVDNVMDANNEEDSSKITTDTIVSKIVTTDTLNLGDKRVIGISTDDNLGGAGASDDSLSTQLSIKSYVDNVMDANNEEDSSKITTDTIVSKIVTTDTLNLGDKRVIGISTDDNLGGAGASDDSLSTQLSIKSYVDNVMDANNEEDSSKITTDTIVSKIVTTDTLNLGDKRVIGISTDDNLGGAGASDDSLSTQLSIKTYVDNVIDGIQNNAPSLTTDTIVSKIVTTDTLNLGDKRVIGISTDDNLGGAGASDDSLSTQLSIKSYVDNVMDANNEEDSSKITTDTIVSKIVTTDTLNLGDKRVIGISTDDNLGGAGASDDSLSTQLSIKSYVDNVMDANNEEDSSKITTDTIVSKIVTTDTLNLGDKRVIGISTDDNLGGAGASDDSLSTQLSIKTYVDNVIDGIQNNAPSLTTDTIVSKIVTTDTLNLGDKRVIGISTDDNLGGAGASDDSLSTQLSIKTYVDNVIDGIQNNAPSLTTDTIVSKIVTTDTLNLGDKRVIGISTDDNLGGAGASDDSLSTQLSIKSYVDNVMDANNEEDSSKITTDTIVSKIVTTDTLNLGDKRVIGISTDDNLGGAGASDDSLSTQLSIKSYVDNVMDANNEEDSSKITTDTIVSKIVTTDTLNLGDKRVIGISTDDNLGGAGASDDSLSTQLSIKTYVDNVIDGIQNNAPSLTTDTIVSKIVTTDTLNLGDKRVIGISTDDNLGGAGASDDSLSTQLSIKTYVDNVIDGIQNNAPSLTTDTIVSKIVTTDTLNLGDKRVIGISTDDNLGGAGASDDSLSTQLSIKSYVDNVMDANNEEDSSKITTDTIVSKIVTTDTLNLGDKRVIGISTDDNLGGAGASDDSLSTQLSIKSYVDNVMDANNEEDSSKITTDTIVSKIVTTDTLNLGDKRVIGISTDDNLGGAGASDDSLSTQLSIKTYVDNVIDAGGQKDTVGIAGVLSKNHIANAGQSLVIDSIKGGSTALNLSTNNGKSNLLLNDTNFVILGANSDTIAWFNYEKNYFRVKGGAYMDSLRILDFASFTTSTFNVPSDKRLKKDIEDIYGGMETIMNLRPVRFKYKDFWAKEHGFKDQYYYSFIAQEFKEIFPDDVFESGLYLKEDKESVLNININSAQIVTIKAVQELVVKYKELEAENKELKVVVGSLKGVKEEFNELKAEVETLKSLLLNRTEK